MYTTRCSLLTVVAYGTWENAHHYWTGSVIYDNVTIAEKSTNNWDTSLLTVYNAINGLAPPYIRKRLWQSAGTMNKMTVRLHGTSLSLEILTSSTLATLKNRLKTLFVLIVTPHIVTASQSINSRCCIGRCHAMIWHLASSLLLLTGVSDSIIHRGSTTVYQYHTTTHKHV